MSERANQLLDEVLALPLDERELFADRFWERLEEVPPSFESAEVEAEHAELMRRLDMVEKGTADSLPHDAAMIEMRAELVRRRAERSGP
jgi:putative addiction module component (TIGR02574 family)